MNLFGVERMKNKDLHFSLIIRDFLGVQWHIHVQWQVNLRCKYIDQLNINFCKREVIVFHCHFDGKLDHFPLLKRRRLCFRLSHYKIRMDHHLTKIVNEVRKDLIFTKSAFKKALDGGVYL